jgi:hypothetical protein
VIYTSTYIHQRIHIHIHIYIHIHKHRQGNLNINISMCSLGTSLPGVPGNSLGTLSIVIPRDRLFSLAAPHQEAGQLSWLLISQSHVNPEYLRYLNSPNILLNRISTAILPLYRVSDIALRYSKYLHPPESSTGLLFPAHRLPFFVKGRLQFRRFADSTVRECNKHQTSN